MDRIATVLGIIFNIIILYVLVINENKDLWHYSLFAYLVLSGLITHIKTHKLTMDWYNKSLFIQVGDGLLDLFIKAISRRIGIEMIAFAVSILVGSIGGWLVVLIDCLIKYKANLGRVGIISLSILQVCLIYLLFLYIESQNKSNNVIQSVDLSTKDISINNVGIANPSPTKSEINTSNEVKKDDIPVQNNYFHSERQSSESKIENNLVIEENNKTSDIKRNSNAKNIHEEPEYPDQLINIIEQSDWSYVRSALAFAYSLGKKPEYVHWANKTNGHKGTLILTGLEGDSKKCRQFRITRLIGKQSLSEYVEFCKDGTVK